MTGGRRGAFGLSQEEKMKGGGSMGERGLPGVSCRRRFTKGERKKGRENTIGGSRAAGFRKDILLQYDLSEGRRRASG